MINIISHLTSRRKQYCHLNALCKWRTKEIWEKLWAHIPSHATNIEVLVTPAHLMEVEHRVSLDRCMHKNANITTPLLNVQNRKSRILRVEVLDVKVTDRKSRIRVFVSTNLHSRVNLGTETNCTEIWYKPKRNIIIWKSSTAQSLATQKGHTPTKHSEWKWEILIKWSILKYSETVQYATSRKWLLRIINVTLEKDTAD